MDWKGNEMKAREHAEAMPLVLVTIASSPAVAAQGKEYADLAGVDEEVYEDMLAWLSQVSEAVDAARVEIATLRKHSHVRKGEVMTKQPRCCSWEHHPDSDCPKRCHCGNRAHEGYSECWSCREYTLWCAERYL
jgi:hypothetical protein